MYGKSILDLSEDEVQRYDEAVALSLSLLIEYAQVFCRELDLALSCSQGVPPSLGADEQWTYCEKVLQATGSDYQAAQITMSSVLGEIGIACLGGLLRCKRALFYLCTHS